MKTKRLLIFSFLFLIASIISVVIYFYSLKIHFTGKIIFEPLSSIEKLEYTTPLNKTYNRLSADQPLSGYFKEIVFIKSDTYVNPVFYQVFANNPTKLNYINISSNAYKLTPPKLNFFQKIQAIAFYNKKQLLIGIICLLVFVFILINFKKIVKLIKNSFISLYKDVGYTYKFILKEKKSILIALLLSLLVYPVFFFIFDINFSVLYNVSLLVIYPIISAVFFIPIFGAIVDKKVLKLGSGFFVFWIVLFLLYFVVSPFVFAGNFGFYGDFHNFIIISQQNGFFQSLIFPDTGYLAVLPRIIYGLAIWVSPDGSQSIAVTSIASLSIYSFILSFLASERFQFLWPKHWIGLFFILLIAISPIFSLVPGLNFPLAITDTAYYGILFSFILLFIISEFKIRSVCFLTLINCIFILSKAHLLALFPLYSIGLIVFLKDKKNKGVFFTVVSLFAMLTQLAFCYFHMVSLSAYNQTGGSFSVNMLGLEEQIIVAVAYYLKAYIYILMPFVYTTGKYVIIFMVVFFAIVLALFFIALKIIRKPTTKLIASWFIAGNILAFSSAMFYSYTFPGDVDINRDSVINLIRSVDVNLMRYTIGIHTILAVSVIPFIIFLVSEMFKRVMPKYSLNISIVLFFALIINGIIFNKAVHVISNFWGTTKGDIWSYEWEQLAPLLKNKEHYVPIVFYPAYKQAIKTENLEVSNDFVPKEQSDFSLNGEKNVHAVIVLNALGNKEEQIPVIAETFFHSKKVAQLAPFYLPNKNMRFIYFLNKKTSSVDSIVFLNHFHKPALINTHIRIVSKTKK